MPCTVEELVAKATEFCMMHGADISIRSVCGKTVVDTAADIEMPQVCAAPLGLFLNQGIFR